MKFNYFLIPLLYIGMMSSCSNEDDDSMLKDEIGRFDNKPFVWDVISTNTNPNNVFIENTDVYVGGVYPRVSIENGLFDQESIEVRNPIDLIFEFNDPYIDEVTRGTGSVGYLLALKRALKSYEYTSHINTSVSKIDYKITEFYSLNDLQKLFNTSLFDRYKIKIEENRKNKKNKSKLIAMILNLNFSVYMDFPTEGIFQKFEHNNSSDLYVGSVSYGNVAYFVVESPYSYYEVESTIEKLIIDKFLTVNMTDKEKEILKESCISICIKDAKIDNSYFCNDLQKYGNIIFTEDIIGYPIYVQLRDLNNITY